MVGWKSVGWKSKHEDIPPPPKGERLYKLMRKCQGCGVKFTPKHKLRKYCDDCKLKNDTNRS